MRIRWWRRPSMIESAVGVCEPATAYLNRSGGRPPPDWAAPTVPLPTIAPLLTPAQQARANP